MDTENPEQTQKIEQAVADLSRRYDVRVKDLGNDRFRITLANEACRQEMRNYKAALEHQKILDAVANKTTAAVCMLMVQALLSTSNKPCESYQEGTPCSKRAKSRRRTTGRSRSRSRTSKRATS